MFIRELILEKISSTQSRKLVEVEGFLNIEKNLKKGIFFFTSINMESVSLKYGVISELQPKKELHSNSSTTYAFRFIVIDSVI